jgi:sporulation protein YlmC with PRC-barrel domain
MKLKMLTMSAATAALLATGALAQNTTTQPAQPMEKAPATGAATTTTTSTTTEAIQFTSSVATDQMLVSNLSGTAVRNAADENLGDINDVVIDSSGKPSVAIIGVGGFLGIGEKDVGVPFDALKFTMTNENKERVARLDVTKEALQAAPTFVYADEAATNTTPNATPPKTQ